MTIDDNGGKTVIESTIPNHVRTVLCVDDNAINREILCEVFEEDYHVLTATNGVEALEALRSGTTVSAVLLDLMMPVMDGRTFLREVSKDPDLRDIPVLVVTGDESTDAEADCLDLGASDFIPKPIDPRIAKLRVAAVIRLRETSSALSMVGIDSDTGLLTRQAFVYTAESSLAIHPDKKFAIFEIAIVDFASLCARKGTDEVLEMLKRIGAGVKQNANAVVSGYLGEGRFVTLAFMDSNNVSEAGALEIIDYARQIVGFDTIFKLGIAPCANHAGAVSEAMGFAADAILRIEKDDTVFVAFHDEKAQAALDRRRLLSSSAAASLENGDFYVVYQPKHNAKTGELVGCEALVRWNHPELGFVSPGEFIPLFEENGFVSEVDSFVRKQSHTDMISWLEAGLDPIEVSTNFSRRELQDCGYISDFIATARHDERLPREFFHAEVTETMWSDDSASVIKSLHLLKEAGYQIELDDFGSGYSSLSMVAKLPLDVIKLDMSLVREIDEQEPVIKCSVDLAHNLGKTVVAEGAEDADTVARLADLGVDLIQGYYFSRPLPEAEFIEYIRRAQSRA